MGVDPVAHIEGGFTAWKAAGAPVAQRAAKVANPERPDGTARPALPALVNQPDPSDRPDKGTAAANEPRS